MTTKVHPVGEPTERPPEMKMKEADESDDEEDELLKLKDLVGAMKKENEADRLQQSQRRAAMFVKAKEEEQTLTHEEGHKHTWRMSLLHKLHHHYFQAFLICLLLIDVIVVVLELFLEAQFPSCKIIERDAVSCVPNVCVVHSGHGSHAASHASTAAHASSSSHSSTAAHASSASHSHTPAPTPAPSHGHGHSRRIAEFQEGFEWKEDTSWLEDEPLSLWSWEHMGRSLSGDAHGGHGPKCPDHDKYSPLESAKATCDEHKYGWLHTVHPLLVGLSVFILGVFFIELGLLFLCLGCGFFRNPLYIADFFIVSVSLILEFILMNVNEQSLVSLLLFARFWRFVRVAHGLITSVHEPMSHKVEHMEDIVDQLTDRVEKMSRMRDDMLEHLTKDMPDAKEKIKEARHYAHVKSTERKKGLHAKAGENPHGEALREAGHTHG